MNSEGRLKKQLHLFNHLSRQEEIFDPKNHNDVTIYCCGPTVHDVPHLGHARTYIFSDMISRILKYHYGYGVRLMINITDLDDKIISKGGSEIAQKFEKVFFEKMDLLNVERPFFAPRVTESMEIIKAFVFKKLDGFTYTNDDGDVLFDSQKTDTLVFRSSGKRKNLKHLENDPTNKNPRDFVVWKKKEWIDSNGLKQYDMPGWHSECAAMASYYFDNHLDIHVGGIDLKFPHHENEITLGKCYLQKEWVDVCLYTGHVMSRGVKMSKSDKNYVSVDDVLNAGYHPLALRWYFLKHIFSRPLEYKEKSLQIAAVEYEAFCKNIRKIWTVFSSKEDADFPPFNPEHLNELNRTQKCMTFYFNRNLTIDRALGDLEFFVRNMANEKIGTMSKVSIKCCLDHIMYMSTNVFGIIEKMKNIDLPSDDGRLFAMMNKFRNNVRMSVLNSDCHCKHDILPLCDGLRDDVNSKTDFIVEDGKL